jgi:hypothetical protein
MPLSAVLLVLTMSNSVRADDVQIVAANLRGTQENVWQISVTLKQGDTGWDTCTSRRHERVTTRTVTNRL